MSTLAKNINIYYTFQAFNQVGFVVNFSRPAIIGPTKRQNRN